ncbi:MAG: hypothetical protein BMS9Abin37_1429 [Acidobacteriota bacterium]|nr:MAG: hypothetical protein BMS9Abin37_1429 [Acidobacteriota bacterium]
MLVLSSLAALFLAQFLPGFLLVKLLDVGRDREERFVMAAVFGGPIAALLYLVVLLSDWSPLYWLLLVNLAVAAVVVPFRSPQSFRWPRSTMLTLMAILVAACVPYLLTTGSSFLPDAEGSLVVDRALQRDVLFHLGIIRSLEHDYPPALLSMSGIPVGYHVGYHLQLAAWARFFQIDAIDGLLRVGTLWQLMLLVASAFVLARRFTENNTGHLLLPILILCAGFGYLFFLRPTVDWWSLVFMDVTLVSVFLANPLLPALPVLFIGLALFDDYTRGEGRGALAGSSVCSVFLLVVKMFLGAQLLAAMGLAAVWNWGNRKLRTAIIVISMASLPFLAHTFLAAEGSNTNVGLRPLEIVRYSMEKLDWSRAIEAVAAVGRFDAPSIAWVLAFAVTLFWITGFLGLRLVGVRRWVRDLGSNATPLRRTMAWFVAIGFPVALVFRIAPAESQALSRLEAQNDVVWFAAASGILLWFWVADAVRGRAAFIAVLVLALPSTVQHFVYAASLEPDRIGIARVLAARAAAALSEPDALWLDPLDRSRPSLLPYLAGRAVVYDPYVGYDYMFVGRDEIDFRRHALAQFWSSGDLAYRAWVLDHFDVDFVWQQGGEVGPIPGLEGIYSGDSVLLLRVNGPALARAALPGIMTPTSIPLGARGSPFLGTGFTRVGRVRHLKPGSSRIYVPRAAGRKLGISFLAQPQHGGGELVVDGKRLDVGAGQMRIRVELVARGESGLHAIDVEWSGERPLEIVEIRLDP